MIAVVDQRMSPLMQRSLWEHGFSVIPLPAFSRLSEPVASHPDMLIFPFEGTLFVHKEYYKEAHSVVDEIVALSGHSLLLIETEVSPKYPHDVALNLFCLGSNIFGKANTVPKTLRDYAQQRGYGIINTKQGYAKCSTVLLGNNAIVTADRSIQAAADKIGTDVLFVSASGVALPPYAYGFLGGASGYCNNTVYFCGDITLHPDAQSITSFCQKYNRTIVCLSDEPLTDMGSILFL